VGWTLEGRMRLALWGFAASRRSRALSNTLVALRRPKRPRNGDTVAMSAPRLKLATGTKSAEDNMTILGTLHLLGNEVIR
jgi:hypothetical protein